MVASRDQDGTRLTFEITIDPRLAPALAAGHPWVYRTHVVGVRRKTGDWVCVRAGGYRAFGLWDDESPIAVRLFSTEGVPDSAWVRARIQEAWALRAPLREQGVTGFRWVFGEADQLPGVVVDLYDRYAVVVTYSRALGALLPSLVQALALVAPLRGVVRRHKSQTGEVRLEPLFGEAPPEEIVVCEHGMELLAQLSSGQKTGLFFDHRENRAYVRSRSRGARVLNLFAYTGAFSVAAGLGGAKEVTSVDIAGPAIEMARKNFARNGLDQPHRALAVDAFEFLETAVRDGERFDLVICDPPSFAKNRQQVRAAEKAYKRLMSLGLEVTVPGGTFCAASCTSQIGPAAFHQLLRESARKARCRYQVVFESGQPQDHPVSIAHEEGRYLKFVAGRVLSRC